MRRLKVGGFFALVLQVVGTHGTRALGGTVCTGAGVAAVGVFSGA